MNQENAQNISAQTNELPVMQPDPHNEFIEDNDFSYEGYQVVRGEFFAHQSEPSITFNQNKVSVNKAAINKLPEVEYVQFLVNSEKKMLLLRACKEDEKDAFRWCREKNGSKVQKKFNCSIFFAKLCELTKWTIDNRYKILGKMIKSNGEYLFVFDLKNAEVYKRISKDGDKPKTSRTPQYPASWDNQFGLSVEEHKKSLQVNMFDGYAVFSMKDKNTDESHNEANGNEVQNI